MVLVTSKTEALIEKGEKRKRGMNVGLQSAAAAAALEGNNRPGALLMGVHMYRALCGLALQPRPSVATSIKLQKRSKQNRKGWVSLQVSNLLISHILNYCFIYIHLTNRHNSFQFWMNLLLTALKKKIICCYGYCSFGASRLTD